MGGAGDPVLVLCAIRLGACMCSGEPYDSHSRPQPKTYWNQPIMMLLGKPNVSRVLLLSGKEPNPRFVKVPLGFHH